MIEWWGSLKRSSKVSWVCLCRRWPRRVSTIALVESRSWTNSGRVGTSNESRSALPPGWDRPRHGLESVGQHDALGRVTDSRSRRSGSSSGPPPPPEGRRPAVQALPGSARPAPRRVLPVPVEGRGERGIVAIGYWRLFLLESRLRPHIGPHRASRLGVLERVVLGSCRLLLGHRAFHLNIQ